MTLTRDNAVWTIAFIGSVLLFVVMSTDLIPHEYADKVKDVAAVCGFVAGLLRGSPLDLSQQGRYEYEKARLPPTLPPPARPGND